MSSAYDDDRWLTWQSAGPLPDEPGDLGSPDDEAAGLLRWWDYAPRSSRERLLAAAPGLVGAIVRLAAARQR